MKNPPHPGVMLETLYIEPLGLTITEVAKGLGVSRKTVSDLVNGYRPLSLDMALRIAKAFNTKPELWLDFQKKYELAQAKLKNGKWVDLSNVKVLYNPTHISTI